MLNQGKLLTADAFELALEQLESLKLADGSQSVLRQTLTAAFQEAEYYKGLFGKLLSYKAKFIEGRRLACEIDENLKDIMGEAPLGVANERAEAILRVVPRLLVALDDDFTRELIKSVREGLTSLSLRGAWRRRSSTSAARAT